MVSKIIFYDGDCGLCQRSILFVFIKDSQKQIHFAPLNGETYRSYLGEEKADLSTVIYFKDGQKYIKSTGALEVLGDLGVKYKWMKIALIIPLFIRDLVYDFIAKNRTKVSCPILPASFTKDSRLLR